MKVTYPLKKSQQANLVEPIVKYLEVSESPQIAFSFRQNLTKINQLRNKVTVLELPQNPSVEIIDKYIPALEMYIKYALMLSKHLNWNKQYGVIVQDLQLVWYDSFNPSLKFMKNQIHYDIYCCFYNLAIMYFHKASILCMQDLMSSKKQSIRSGKIAFYLLNQMRTIYYPAFMNTGFSDTNFSHLQMLQLLVQGIIYKSLFNLFKEDQYKLGINNIASIAGLAQKNFFNAYTIGTQFFMKSSNIPPSIKSELLSFAYVQALYHDAMYNTKWAKYYHEQMDNNKDNIVNLIAYQRKALRFLDLGLKNQAVTHLLDNRPQQKKQLLNIRPQIQASLKQNLLRNKQIYKKPQIAQQNIPVPMEAPKKYIAEPIQPQNIKINYDNPIAAPFAKLIDNQSKSFMLQLKQFSKNRINGLQSAFSKLQKNIQTIYNDNFVNFYLNLQNNNKNKGFPQNLKQKIDQIKSNGGKQKLDIQITIIKKNQQQIGSRFKQMYTMINDEENYDKKKRNQYGNKWNRPPSNIVNRSYVNQLQVYQKKSEQAYVVNQKIIEKYHNLEKYINVVDESEETIAKVLPKVQVTKFLQENKNEFEKLRNGVASVKQKNDNINCLTGDIKKFFGKLDYTEEANKFFKDAKTQNKEQIFQKIFGKGYKLIEQFNQKAKLLQQDAKKVGQISMNLNQKNKGDEKSKKQFQEVMSKFNDISNLFRQVAQGTGFYTKLNQILIKIFEDLEGFLTARKVEADQLENSCRKGGFGAGNNLPNMYPNRPAQQNLGFYIPPPMNFSNQQGNQNMGYQQNSDMSDMLADIMRSKPNFGGDVFGGPVFQSKYR